MPLGIPFTVTSSLAFSPDGVAPSSTQSQSATGTYDQKDDDQLSLTGAGTATLTLKGPAKALQISVDPSTTAAEINVQLNSSGNDDIEIAPGGHVQIFNPIPNVGITALDIVYTTSCVVKVIALA